MPPAPRLSIPDSAKERIFTPFTQADSSTSRNYGGTGIGLNISKQLVQLMSGKVTFSSRVDAGTTFRMDVSMKYHPSTKRSRAPSSDPQLVELSNPAIPSSPGTGESIKGTAEKQVCLDERPKGLAGLHALCIDNNGLRADVTSHYLRRLGINAEPLLVEGTSLWKGPDSNLDPPPALELSQKPTAHIAFLEMFPADGGWSLGLNAAFPTPSPQPVEGTTWTQVYLKKVCRKARELDARLSQSPLTPLLLISNEQEPRLEAAAKAAGFAGVITKPLRCTNLGACLREALGIAGGNRNPSGLQSGEAPSLGLDILKGKNFMVVDDNAVNRKVASKILEKYGVIVTCMPSGIEAVKTLTGTHEFSIVFMDIQMPGMDGYETTRAIRSLETSGQSSGPPSARNKNRTPILAMTADVMKGSWEKCKESGMDGFVTKPIEEQRLLRVVREFLSPPSDESPDEEEE